MMPSTTDKHKPEIPRRFRPVITALFWIAVWWFAAVHVGQELILPAPLTVLKTLVTLVREWSFWRAAGISLLRVFGGFAAGVVLGTLFSVLTSVSSIADLLISPIIRIVRSTPVASFIILALLWIGKSQVPCFISMLMVIPVVWDATSSAIAETDPKLLELAHTYSFGRWRTLRLVYVPSIRTQWIAASVTSLGLAWKSGIAAEVLCLPSSAIGSGIYFSKIYLDTDALFAWTTVVILLSFALEKCFKALAGKRRQP